MEFLQNFLPIIIYLLLIVFLVIAIVIGIKLIKTLTRLELVVDDINKKVQSLNGIFNIINYTTEKFNVITDKVIDGISLLINKIFFKKGKDDDYE